MSRPCVWLGRDDEGRPYCVHGPARKQGAYWRCREKHKASAAKYAATDKGAATRRRSNANPTTQSRKALYELTRIRVS